MKTTFEIDVHLDPKFTTPEDVAEALDLLMENALSTPNVLEGVNNPVVGAFCIQKERAPVKHGYKTILITVDGVVKHPASRSSIFERVAECIKRGWPGEDNGVFWSCRLSDIPRTATELRITIEVKHPGNLSSDDVYERFMNCLESGDRAQGLIDDGILCTSNWCEGPRAEGVTKKPKPDVEEAAETASRDAFRAGFTDSGGGKDKAIQPPTRGMQIALIQTEVDFDSKVTDAQSIALLFDELVSDARNDDVLSDYGNPIISPFYVPLDDDDDASQDSEIEPEVHARDAAPPNTKNFEFVADVTHPIDLKPLAAFWKIAGSWEALDYSRALEGKGLSLTLRLPTGSERVVPGKLQLVIDAKYPCNLKREEAFRKIAEMWEASECARLLMSKDVCIEPHMLSSQDAAPPPAQAGEKGREGEVVGERTKKGSEAVDTAGEKWSTQFLRGLIIRELKLSSIADNWAILHAVRSEGVVWREAIFELRDTLKITGEDPRRITEAVRELAEFHEDQVRELDKKNRALREEVARLEGIIEGVARLEGIIEGMKR